MQKIIKNKEPYIKLILINILTIKNKFKYFNFLDRTLFLKMLQTQKHV